MAKNFRTQLGGAVGLAASIQQRTGIRLSDVQFIRPSELSQNPLNTQFFSDESEEYFEKLRKDVKERGILVPLIAKRSGVLLAGHNRLRVAQELNIDIVPVQFVQDDLNEEQETVFVINDNLLRRHLTDEQRFTLYRLRYPNFDERLAQRGRPAKNGTQKTVSEESSKQSSKQFSEKRYGVPFSEKKNISPLTAKKIADDTGQTEGAVKQQIKRMRAKEAESSRTKNTIADKEVNKPLLKKLEKMLYGMENMNEATRKEVLKTLRVFMKKNAV